MSLMSDIAGRLMPGFDPITKLGSLLIEKIWPDPEKQAQAQLELLKMQQSGELDALRLQLSAILAEAQSADPWTSRARPSFLYVMYLMILMAIPVAFVGVFYPEGALRFAAGMQAFLKAIPDALWSLFGVGYLGYAGVRSWEKGKGLAK